MRVTSAAVLTLLVSIPWTGGAATEAPAARSTTFTYTASTTYSTLLAADLADGGSAASQRVGVSAGVAWRPTPGFSIGTSLNYEAQRWAFETGPAFGVAAPWDALERGSASLPIVLALSRQFVTTASPFAEWSYERDAGTTDALTYGATLGAFGIFSPRLTLGGGAKVHHQFFRTKLTPFLIINWQLSSKLRIANSLAAGPLGSGGVELRYAPAPLWEVSVGGVTRSDRFRMEPEGTGSGDIGEQAGIPAYGRVSYGVGARLRVDAYVGALVSGHLRRFAPEGAELVDTKVSTAPGFALGVSSRW